MRPWSCSTHSILAVFAMACAFALASPVLAGDRYAVDDSDLRAGDERADEILGKGRPAKGGLLAQRFRRTEDDFGDDGFDEGYGEGDYGDEGFDEGSEGFDEGDFGEGDYGEFDGSDPYGDPYGETGSGWDDPGMFGEGGSFKQSPFRILGGLVINYGRNENTDLGFGLQAYAQYNINKTWFVEGGLGFQSIGIRGEENTLAELDAKTAGYTGTGGGSLATPVASGGDSCTIIPLTAGIFGQSFFDGGRMYYGLGLGYYMGTYDVTLRSTNPAATITQTAETTLGHFLSVGVEYQWKPNINLLAEARLKVVRLDLTTSGDTLGTFGSKRSSLFMDSFDYTFGIAWNW